MARDGTSLNISILTFTNKDIMEEDEIEELHDMCENNKNFEIDELPF